MRFRIGLIKIDRSSDQSPTTMNPTEMVKVLDSKFELFGDRLTENR